MLAGGSLAKGFPEDRNAAAERTLLDETVGPDLGEQTVLLDEMSRVLDQHAKDLEDLRGEHDGLTVLQQQVLRRIQAGTGRTGMTAWRCGSYDAPIRWKGVFGGILKRFRSSLQGLSASPDSIPSWLTSDGQRGEIAMRKTTLPILFLATGRRGVRRDLDAIRSSQPADTFTRRCRLPPGLTVPLPLRRWRAARRLSKASSWTTT